MNMNSNNLDQIGRLKMELPFLAGCVVGKYLYFAAWLENGLFRLDLETWLCTPLKKFEHEEESVLMYDQAIYHNGDMWVIPYHAGNIVKINLQTLDMTYIPLPDKGRDVLNDQGKRVWRFKCCYDKEKEKLWLSPIGYNTFLSVDMKTNQIERFEGTKKIIFENGKINFIDACLKDNEIWLCPYDYERLAIYNKEKKCFSFHEWKHTNERFGCIRNYKNWMIFIPQELDKYILLIEKDTFVEKKILLNINWEKREKLMYRTADIEGDCLLLAPFLAKEFVSINLNSGEIKSDTGFHEPLDNNHWSAERYQCSFKYGSQIIYISDKPETPLMIHDFKKDKFCHKSLYMNLNDYRDFFLNFALEDRENILRRIQNKQSIYLEKKLPLTLYCEMIKKSLLQSNQENSCRFGKRIFEYIKRK